MDIGKGIQRAIDVYFKNFGLLFLATLIVIAIVGVAALVVGGVLGAVLIGPERSEVCYSP